MHHRGCSLVMMTSEGCFTALCEKGGEKSCTGLAGLTCSSTSCAYVCVSDGVELQNWLGGCCHSGAAQVRFV